MKVYEFDSLPKDVMNALATIALFVWQGQKRDIGVYIASNGNLVTEELLPMEQVELDCFPESMTCHVQAPNKFYAALV
jgi:hypothetical protein